MMYGNVMLIAVYVVAWAFAFGYMIHLAKRQTRLQREVDALRRVLDEYAQPERNISQAATDMSSGPSSSQTTRPSAGSTTGYGASHRS